METMRFPLLIVSIAATLVVRADFEVYFMRHGETPWNRAKVLQGSIAYTDLTAVGVGMAEDSAAEFRRRGITFGAVYTSPLRRARHTAEIIAATQGLEVRVDERIRERCGGSCEGVRYGTSGRLAELLRSATGVESVEAVGDRAMDFLEKELAPLDGKVSRVLCVGHTLLLSVIEARLAGRREVGKDLLPNCCVHVLVFSDGRFSLRDRARVFYDPAQYGGRSKVRYVAHRGAGDLTIADEFGLFGVNMPVLEDQTSPDAIAELKRRGVWVSLWFVLDAQKAAKYRDTGCDAFVTDYVSKVR